MPDKKLKISPENTKLIGVTILVTIFLLFGVAYFFDHLLKLDVLPSPFDRGNPVQHYVYMNMISTSGDFSFLMELKIGFEKKRKAKQCKEKIPRIKNDILMLDLAKEIESRDLPEIKEKISTVVCKHCPDAEGNVLFDNFTQQ